MRTAQGSIAVCDCAWLRIAAILSILFSPTVQIGFCQDAVTPIEPAKVAEAQAVVPVPELYQRIDAMLSSNGNLFVASQAQDGELLRRLSLDLRGVVPTREELDAFAQDQSPGRWRSWVNRFLADPLCDEHFVNFLDRTIMLRRAHTQVDRASWLAFLREQVASNAPLDQFSKRILYSPWWNKDHRVVQKFFLDRGGDPNLIARDVGRVFLGQDLQCAQCHDHPLVDDYKQTDYHGLVAFFTPSKLAEATYKDAEGKDQKMQLYVETPGGDPAFESVFDKGVPYRSGPRLPSRAEQFEDYLMPDERLVPTAPADAFSGVPIPPKVSRRQILAEQLTTRDNLPFVSNWANRLWALAFGQGLVHPVDMQHADNPPIHPALFSLITEGLVAADMQPRRFIEQLVLTQAYQRSGFSVLEASAPQAFPPSLSAEQRMALGQSTEAKRVAITSGLEALTASEAAAKQAYDAALEAWNKIQASRAAIRTELDATETALLAEKKKSSDAATLLAAAEKKRTDTQSRIALLDEAAAKLDQAVVLAGAEDAELKQAIAVSKQRAEAVKATLPAVEKSVADAKAAADAVVPTLAQAVAKTQEVVAKLKPVHDALHVADEALLAARKQWEKANVARLDSKRQLAHAEHTLAWLASFADSERVQSELTLVAQAVPAAEAEVAQVTQVVVAAQTKLAESTRVQTANGEIMAKTQKAIEQHTAENTRLQQSMDALAQATEIVAATETLNAAKETIRVELERRRTQTGQLESELAKAQQAVNESIALVTQDQQALEARKSEAMQTEQKLTKTREQLTLKQNELSATQKVAEDRWAVINEECATQLDKTRLAALTPEQLSLSILRITGQLDAYIQIEMAELEKQTPLPADADEATKVARKRQAVRGAVDKLRGIADQFVALYGSGPDKTQDEFFASADQALYTANAGSVFGWAAPGNNNVTQHAITLTEGNQIAQAIYWGLLCRQPTEVEKKLVADQLASAGDARNTVIQEMVWGILASAEFRFCR